MKKLLAFSYLMFASVLLFAQDTLGGGSDGGSLDPLAVIFASVTALAVVIIPITMAAIRVLGIKEYKQLFSWVVGILLAVGAKYLGLGAFASYDWFWTISNGLIAALTANGATNIPWVRSILDAVYRKIN